MIPRFGMEGAAVATLISIFIYNAGKMIFIWRKFRMLPLSLKNLWLALISAAILYLALVIPRLELAWLDIIVRSAGITLVFGVTVLIFRISDEVNQLFFQTLKRFKIHFRP
jgi:O-antigen/teichoic acid export membrane protein